MLPPFVEHHSANDDRAHRHDLKVRVKLDIGEPGLDHAEHHGPQNRADDGPAPTSQADPADHRHRDGVKLVEQPHAGLRREVFGAEDNGRKGRQHRRDHVDHDLVPSDVDPRHARRVFVRSDGIGVLAIDRVAQQHMAQDRQHHEPDNRHHARAQTSVAFGRERHGLATGPPLRNTAADQEHAQRRDERRDAREGDEHAIDRADEGTEGQTDNDWNNHWQIKGPRPEHRFGVGVAVDQFGLGKRHHDHRGGGDQWPRGQVDPAGNDDLRHAQRDDPDNRHLQNDDLQPRFVEDGIEPVIGVEQKALPIHVGQHLTEHFKDRNDDHKRDEDVEFVGPAALGTVVFQPACPLRGLRHG